MDAVENPIAWERVANGAAHLDVVAPDWHNRIDLETLDMENPYKCILGQLYGRYNSPAFDEARVSQFEQRVAFGFVADIGISANGNTPRAPWVHEILARRARDTVA